MDYNIKLDNFEDAKTIRTAVYLKELGFRVEFEPIDEDDRMVHMVLYVDDQPVGAGRVFPIELEHKLPYHDGGWVFGRLAVLKDYRDNGYGAALLKYAEDYAKEHGATTMYLHVQKDLFPYFEEKGYEKFGPQKFDEHVLHQWMKKDLA